MNSNNNLEEELVEIISDYRDLKERYEQERFVELLREIQNEYGCIPSDVQEYVCEELQIKLSVLKSILKFYKSLQSVVRHRIVLCTGPSCMAKDADRFSTVIEEELRKKRKQNIGVSYTFVTQNCMKQCRTSVNVRIDGEYLPSVTEEELRKRIASL